MRAAASHEQCSILAIVVMIMAALAPDGRPASADDGKAIQKVAQNQLPPHSLGPGQYTFTIDVGGESREYFVHVPPGYDKSTPTPVVVNFHGGFGRAETEMGQTQLARKSDQAGFLLVFPEAAVGEPSRIPGLPYKHWNGGPRAESQKSRDVDDVAFVRAMLDQLERDFRVDAKRIYASGISNGGTMVYRLACELSDRIAAVAPVATNQLDIRCQPSRPISVIHFHGLADRYVPFGGGVSSELPDNWRPVMKTIDEWVERNGCDKTPKTTFAKGKAKCVTYGSCRAGTEVVLCTDQDAGHTWPGGTYEGFPICKSRPSGLLCMAMRKKIGPISQDMSANDLIWEFFQKHPLP